MFKQEISGWGGYPIHKAEVLTPSSLVTFRSEIQKQNLLIARGMGRSYGDSANASKVLQTTSFSHFIEFDVDKGILTAEAGITIREILKIIVHQGWFVPVSPGTSYVTLGGAIASDVHGKNHHIAGTFGKHVKSFTLLLGTGEMVKVSPTERPDLFYATCGGMGLTGVILNATIQLFPIQSSYIAQKCIKADCIESAFEAFEDNSKSTYSVAWIDCLATGKNLGRSVLMTGDHMDSGGFDLNIKNPVSIPFHTPASLLNNLTMKVFNNVYWAKAKDNNKKTLPLMSYFYPLDFIRGWNKFYGKSGFLQYQFVIPKTDGATNMRKILTQITESGQGSFLTVLKQFGKVNDNLLSFPMEGYTLALDFKIQSSTIPMLHKLDEMVADMGGRVYLTKDAVMREVTFKKTYLKWQKFETVREKYGAIGKFASTQSKRLGLA